MEPTDLTIEILKGIRSDIQESNRQNAERFEAIDRRFEAMEARFDRRFEVIETALRDMSEQLVMHSRALRTLLERSENIDPRMRSDKWPNDVERRLSALEEGHPA